MSKPDTGNVIDFASHVAARRRPATVPLQSEEQHRYAIEGLCQAIEEHPRSAIDALAALDI